MKYQQQTVHNFDIQALAAKKGCGTESADDGLLWNYIVWDKNHGEDAQTTTVTEPEPDPGNDDNNDPTEP